MIDEKAIETIESIIKRGNDVKIRRKGNDIIVSEVKEEIKYRPSTDCSE